MTDNERQFIEAARAMKAAKKVVTDWMEAEGQKGRLVQAGQAPAWRAYMEASSAYDVAFNAL